MVLASASLLTRVLLSRPLSLRRCGVPAFQQEDDPEPQVHPSYEGRAAGGAHAVHAHQRLLQPLPRDAQVRTSRTYVALCSCTAGCSLSISLAAACTAVDAAVASCASLAVLVDNAASHGMCRPHLCTVRQAVHKLFAPVMVTEERGDEPSIGFLRDLTAMGNTRRGVGRRAHTRASPYNALLVAYLCCYIHPIQNVRA